LFRKSTLRERRFTFPSKKSQRFLLAYLATRDKYGRDDPAHPIDKLRRVGGIPLRRRRVEVVYRIAVMTDEQATTINGEEIRLNDILAYPLYIADS
jgi:hypothetical protein